MVASSSTSAGISDESDDEEPGSVADAEVVVLVNEGASTSSSNASASISILDRLRAPTASELGRKLRVATNPPPCG